MQDLKLRSIGWIIRQTGKTNASETMFTIKMTKEEYMEYMQQQ